MRIALVVPGGVNRDGRYRVIPAILWLIERLARRHDVHVIVPFQEPRPGSWQLLGATVHNIGVRPRRLRAVRTLLRLHRAKPFDVFHAIWALGPGEVALAAARLCRRPVLVHAAGGEFVWLPDIRFGGARRWQDRLRARAVVRHADCVTAASGPMLESLRALGGRPVRVTLGVDTTRWRPCAPRPRPTDRPARLVHVGSLTPVKGHETLLRAAERLVQAGRPLHIDLVGHDALKGALQALVGRLGLGRCVTFHGFLPQEQVMPVVRAADLMVVSSRHEAGPVAFLEAAAVGVPTVGTPVGHLRDLAPTGAATAAVDDDEALAREIGRLLDDDGQRLAVARHAQEAALREDADWTCARFEQLYTAVANGAGDGPHE